MHTRFERIINTLASNLLCLPAVALIISASPAAAQKEIRTEVRSTGNAAQVTITSAETTTVRFSTTLKSNISQFVDLAASGPSGIKGYAEVRQIKRGGKLGPAYRLEFPKKKKGTTKVLTDGSSSQALKLSGVPETRAAGEEPTDEQLSRIAAKTYLSKETIKYLLRFMTEEEIISKYGKTSNPSNPSSPGNPGGSTPTPSEPGELAGRGLVSKDSCDRTITRYQVDFVVDLSGIDRAAAGSSFTISGSIDARTNQASPASIKPVSDGKFAPKPLVLIQGVGYSYYNSGETLRLVKWSKGRPGKGKTLKIEDRVYYRGQSLARSVANGILTGGKGTFEISNGDKVGTACFSLVRARQRVNGYKGGE